ncbi:MAG: Na/Pi cotransporter family protein [Clostridia bacterium]|nr:Na/Pi cotransporter family protein [Clostridia bacterium]
MSISDIIALISGIALFLFGMSLMGDGLKKLSGGKLEPILYKSSGTKIKGILLGTGVTAVIQSSSATAVMTVGFVNSGMMKVRQAVNVIIGAILGTSITGWVICLSYINGAGLVGQIASTATLTGIVAVTGMLIRMIGKKQVTKHIGNIFMGFAVLMFGLSYMSGSVSGLGEEKWFTSAITSLSNPFFGILIGLLFTAILQSASAAVGILQALSVTGAIAFAESVPLLMGICIGASVPVILSAIGAGTEGKRAAAIYPVASVFGVFVCAVAYYTVDAFVDIPFDNMVMNPFTTALVNTVLRLAIVILLFPLTGVIEKVVTAMIKGKKDESDVKPEILLEDRFIAHPALAIEQTEIYIKQMADLAQQGISDALLLFDNFNEEGFSKIKRMEDNVDNYEDSLGTYMMKLTGREMSTAQSEKISLFLHTLSDFERISDHSLNLAESARELFEKNIHFSESADNELRVLFKAVSAVLDLTVESFTNVDMVAASRVEPLEELIDDLCDNMKHNHIDRLQRGECTLNQGFVFNDIVTNCERVSDHCSNIALDIIELAGNELHPHEYTHNLMKQDSEAFREVYDEYSRVFKI